MNNYPEDKQDSKEVDNMEADKDGKKKKKKGTKEEAKEKGNFFYHLAHNPCAVY